LDETKTGPFLLGLNSWEFDPPAGKILALLTDYRHSTGKL
jgi:hypothetical protein